jgi:hypothetical protein
MDAPTIEKIVKDTITVTMQQQTDNLLRSAAANALQLAKDEAAKSKHDILDRVDDSISKSTEHEGYKWNNDINKNNYMELRKVERLWERTERFVDTLQVPDDQKELKTGTMKFITEGKTLTHNRLKVFRFADKEGWVAAMNFVSDDIAEDEKEEKRMKTGKKEAEKARDSKGDKRRAGDRGAGPSRTDYRGRDSDRRSPSSYRRGRGGGNILCYHCNKYGNHVSRDCPQRYKGYHR